MSVRSEFERLLKESDHFRDVINTHRTVTAEILAAFLAELVRNKQISPKSATTMLEELQVPTGHPSLDVNRRYLVSIIRDTLKSME